MAACKGGMMRGKGVEYTGKCSCGKDFSKVVWIRNKKKK